MFNIACNKNVTIYKLTHIGQFNLLILKDTDHENLMVRLGPNLYVEDWLSLKGREHSMDYR